MNFPEFIKIATVPFLHFIELNETDEDNITFISGVEADLIRFISLELGFKYNISVPHDNEWGTLKDGQWTGLIGMVNRCEVDMAIADITITKQRKDAVKFIPYYTDSTTFARSITPPGPNEIFYLNPFRTEVWLMCLFGLITYSYLITFMSKKQNFVRIFMKMVGSFLKQSLDTSFICREYKFILGLWFIFTFLMTLIYCALLQSFMTVPSQPKGIRTIEELYDAVTEGKFKIYAFKGSSDQEFLLQSDNILLRNIGEIIKYRNWIFDVDSLPNTTEPNTGVIGYRSQLEIERKAEDTPSKYIFPENIAVWHAGLALRNDFCCSDTLEKILGRIQNSGITEKMYNAELHRIRRVASKEIYTEISKALTFWNFYGSFLLLGAGYLISLSAFLLEIIKCKLHSI